MSKKRSFQFLKLIATGGFGEVYLCKEINANGIDRLVAVKVLKSDWINNIDVVNRLRDEAKLLALLRHKNIINVFDMTSINGRASIIMEYVEGVDLSIIIETMRANRRRTPISVSLQICAKVAAALDVAYNQPPFPGEAPLKVVHRDIKPGNIMIDTEGMVKILDFGIANSMFEQRVSDTSEIKFGSLEYMAPERLLFEEGTPSSDIYALALVLFECITGEAFGEASKLDDEHIDLVENRLRFLETLISLPIAQEQELLALFRRSLCYEPEERCSPLEFYQRSRALSRMIQGADLIPWAEKAIPVIRKTSKVLIEDGSGQLQGYTLEEDVDILPERLPTPIGDEETEVRFDLPEILEQPRKLSTFVDVQPLEDELEQGTEVFVPPDRTDILGDRSSYFQGESTMSLLGGVDSIKKPTEDFDLMDVSVSLEAFPDEESVVSVVVQPLAFSEPKTQVQKKTVWIVLMIGLSFIGFVGFGFFLRFWVPYFLMEDSGLQQDSAISHVDSAEKKEDIPEKALLFIVEQEGKLKVKCDQETKTAEEHQNGTLIVVFTQENMKKCSVTFMNTEGKRMKSNVIDPIHGSYLCFFQQEDQCELQQ